MINQDGTFQYSNVKSEHLYCDKASQKLHVYPTIIQDGLLKIEWNSSLEYGDVFIFDIYGSKVETLENIAKHSQLDISNLANGVYSLKVQNKNETIGVGRFMVVSH